MGRHKGRWGQNVERWGNAGEGRGMWEGKKTTVPSLTGQGKGGGPFLLLHRSGKTQVVIQEGMWGYRKAR